MKNRKILHIVVLAGFVAVLLAGIGGILCSQTLMPQRFGRDPAELTFSRLPAARTNLSDLIVEGKTTAILVQLRIANTTASGQPVAVSATPDTSGNFRFRTPFHEGAGKYEVTVLVKRPAEPGVFYIIAKFTVTCVMDNKTMPLVFQYYSHDASKLPQQFSLDKRPAETGPELTLSGKSTFRTLMFRIRRDGNPETADIITAVTPGGLFRIRLLLDNGPGDYTVEVRGSDRPSWNLWDTKTIGTFRSKCTASATTVPPRIFVEFADSIKEKVLHIEPVSATTDNTVTISGRTSLKNLCFHVKKKGAPADAPFSIPAFRVFRDGLFSFTHTFTDGPGKYLITARGSEQDSPSLYGPELARFAVTATKPLPAAAGKPAHVHYQKFSRNGGFFLEHFPGSADTSLRVRGRTAYKHLEYYISKTGGSAHMLNMTPVQGRFDLSLPFVEGAGNYTININGEPGLTGAYMDHLATFTVICTGTRPDMLEECNKQVLDFVAGSFNKKYGNGICIDFIHASLRATGGLREYRVIHNPGHPGYVKPPTTGIADLPAWVAYAEKTSPRLGRIVNYPQERLKAGDMVVYMFCTFREGGRDVYLESHASILYKHLGGTRFQLAHQNVNGRPEVVLTERDFGNYVKGYMKFYRPVRAAGTAPR